MFAHDLWYSNAELIVWTITFTKIDWELHVTYPRLLLISKSYDLQGLTDCSSVPCLTYCPVIPRTTSGCWINQVLTFLLFFGMYCFLCTFFGMILLSPPSLLLGMTIFSWIRAACSSPFVVFVDTVRSVPPEWYCLLSSDTLSSLVVSIDHKSTTQYLGRHPCLIQIETIIIELNAEIQFISTYMY